MDIVLSLLVLDILANMVLDVLTVMLTMIVRLQVFINKIEIL
jgi:hypothetical protein